MAALSTPDRTPDGTPDGPPAASLRPSAERFRFVRELGARAVPAWAALESLPDKKTRLVVVERATRRSHSDAAIAEWIRHGRRLQDLEHPNVVRVHDAVIRRDEVLVVSEFVDGELWSTLAQSGSSAGGALDAPRPPLETALRVFVDVLAGLSALHALRDDPDPRAAREPGAAPRRHVHGALTPANVVVGTSGIARIVSASHPGSAAAQCRTTGAAYLAPEVLLEDESADARADVYSVGVFLWEALSGECFLSDMPPSTVVAQLLGGRTPAVTMPAGLPWAVRLQGVVERALSPDPARRFPSAAAMAAELRGIAGIRLPGHAQVASSLGPSFVAGVRARRDELEQGRPRASHPPRSISPGVALADDEVPIDIDEEASQTAPTVPPPPIAPSRVPAPPPVIASADESQVAPATLPPLPGWSAPETTSPAPPLPLSAAPLAPAASSVSPVSPASPALLALPDSSPARTPVAYPSSVSPDDRAKPVRLAVALVALLVSLTAVALAAWALWPAPSISAPQADARGSVIPTSPVSSVPVKAAVVASPPAPAPLPTTAAAAASVAPEPAPLPSPPRAGLISTQPATGGPAALGSTMPAMPAALATPPPAMATPARPTAAPAPARPKARSNHGAYDPQGI